MTQNLLDKILLYLALILVNKILFIQLEVLVS